jgi:V/A-type H+-transporting ATPase subunit A
MIGTVSPAGGNFEEPVTQSTLSTVKTFLGLSYERAYKRFYPAVDPLLSWSRYFDQLEDWFAEHIGSRLGRRGSSDAGAAAPRRCRHQMMQVTGEEGVTLEDFLLYQKAQFVDMVYLQQDAFDDVDASVPDRAPEALLRAGLRAGQPPRRKR